jgi:hypothetical protein
VPVSMPCSACNHRRKRRNDDRHRRCRRRARLRSPRSHPVAAPRRQQEAFVRRTHGSHDVLITPAGVFRHAPPTVGYALFGWPVPRHRVGPGELTVERRRLGRSVVPRRAVDVLGFSLERIGARSQAVRHHSVTDQLRHASPMSGPLSKRRGGSRTPARSQVFRHFSTKDVDVSFHRSETAFT